jgi:hypothetical protein
MAPTRSQDPPPKKRRSFFTSAVPLPLLAIPATPSTSTRVPNSDKVLAALHAPDDPLKNDTPDRVSRPRKAKESPPVIEESTGPSGRGVKRASTIKKKDEEEEDHEEPAPKRTRPTPQVQIKVIKGTKAETAHSTNEALVQAMEMAMRASIAGPEKPYTRGKIWSVGEHLESDDGPPQRGKSGRAVRSFGKGKVGLKNRKITRKGKAKAKEETSDEEEVEGENESGDEEDESESEEEAMAKPNVEVPAQPKDKKKEYMTAGFYCQNPDARASQNLVSRVLKRREDDQAKEANPVEPESSRPKRTTTLAAKQASETNVFPPLPYVHGYELGKRSLRRIPRFEQVSERFDSANSQTPIPRGTRSPPTTSLFADAILI